MVMVPHSKGETGPDFITKQIKDFNFILLLTEGVPIGRAAVICEIPPFSAEVDRLLLGALKNNDIQNYHLSKESSLPMIQK